VSKKVKISKLVLEIGGKKIELSMKQAKELQEVLNDSFGDTEVVFRDRWYSNYHYYPGLMGNTTTTISPADVYCSTAIGGGSSNITDGNHGLGSFQGASISGNITGNTMTLTAQ